MSHRNDGRVFEVTPQRRIVWEYMNPAQDGGSNAVYRAYRVPYEWIPQLQKPAESAVTPPAGMMYPQDPPAAPPGAPRQPAPPGL